MKAGEQDVLVLNTLAAMPFLDWLELAAVAGLAEATAYRILRRLKAQGLVRFLRHASPLTAATRRWHLTASGLERLAAAEGRSVEYLLRSRPVSAHWQRLLLARLDAVAVIHRLASATSAVDEPFRFRWYRALPLDAAVALSGGRTVGVLRQGATTDRTAFADRVNWLVSARQDLPQGLLALFPDETRLRQGRRLLARYPGPVYLAQERDAARLTADDAVWRVPSVSAVLSLEEALASLRLGGGLPTETPLARVSLPEAVGIDEPGEDGPNHLLPVLLKPADQRLLDCLADWAWATVADLCRFLDLSDSRVWRRVARLENLGLVVKGNLGGTRRLALGERGLTLLARRDWASVATALRRWSVQDEEGQPAAHWREVPRRSQPPPGPHHRAHRRGAPVPGRPAPAGRGDPRIPGSPGVAAPSLYPLLPAPRRPPLHPSRRLRCGAGSWQDLPLLPGVGAPRRPSLHHGRPPGSLPALLFLQPTPGRPRTPAPVPSGFR